MNHTMNALSALLQRNEGEAKTDDYTGEDGLLHCGKCHAPRQMHAPDYIRRTTGEAVVWIPCDCEANERATLRQQREQERREQQLRTLKVNGFSDVSIHRLSIFYRGPVRAVLFLWRRCDLVQRHPVRGCAA